MNETQPPTQLLMACLGDTSRFRLVQALLPGARCVSDLAADVGLSQSCTTRHLQALERRGVVVGAREGKRVLYRLRFDRPELAPLLAWALRIEAAELSGPPGNGTPVAARTPETNGPSRVPRKRPVPSAPARPPAAAGDSPSLAGRAMAGATPPIDLAPLPDPEPEVVPVRRRRPADIEDYLL